MLKTPPLQTATATIDTLCGRLQSATLLEDRRSAIMGLRSFAKQYPASVASGSLRELIAILRRDGLGEAEDTKSANGRERPDGDVDTIRLVLETLLMLFNPDSSSPEASEEIALFMADEFSMRQDNVTLLLSFLDPTSPVADYYSRLYSIQLLSAICAARPERLQECVLGAPLGVSRVVSMLDDGRDAVRNAGLVFLVDLTTGASDDLRKIVAFEDVFSKIFALIRLEGGLGEAGIIAQDCLSLLANLLRDSSSNQTMFRESGCVKEIHTLLQESISTFPHAEVDFVSQNREKATWGLLQLLGVILAPGQAGTIHNQTTFFRVGTAQTLIDLGFAAGIPLPIRISALKNAAMLIDTNAPLQEAFASLSVVVADNADIHTTASNHVNGDYSKEAVSRENQKPAGESIRTYVIEALLTLSLQTQQEFILRLTSTELIEAYLHGHERIRAHFLQRAIAGYAEHEPAANVLTSLLHPGADLSAMTFASQTVAGLIDDDLEAKSALARVKEGDESEGEDVLTAIQILGAQLEGALQPDSDVRVVAAYAGLLTVALWDFSEGIDQLLADGSSLIQALALLIDANIHPPILAGLSAVLLGVIYEFSSKDSPIPRRTLAPILTQKVGRTKYLNALNVLRKVPAVRDFDLDDIADVDRLLSQPFIDLFTTEFTRLRKAIDKDPRIEVVQLASAQTGVDRDVLDTLRDEIVSLKETLTTAQAEAETSLQKSERERLTVSQDLQRASVEVDRIRKINESIQQGHEKDHNQLIKNHEQQIQQLRVEHARTMADARQEEKRQAQQTSQENERKHIEKIKEMERRLTEAGNAHRVEQAAHQTSRQNLEMLTSKQKEITAREASLVKELTDLTARHAKAQRDAQDAQVQVNGLSQELSTLRPKVDQLEVEIERISKAKQEVENEIQTRNEELKAERAGFADLEKELVTSRSKTAALEKEQASSKDTKRKLNDLEKELSVSQSRTAELEKQVSASQAKATSAEKEVKNLKSKAKETEKELSDRHNKIKSLESDLGSAHNKASTDRSSGDKLRKELKTKTDELTAEQAKVNKLEKEVQVAKKALATAQSKTPDNKNATKDSAAKTTQLEKELSEAREAEKNAREELESMLLVMGDIESKRDEYRAKVKELGGEVSEDEDDEDDEDEDEEDEEDGEGDSAKAANNDDDDVD